MTAAAGGTVSRTGRGLFPRRRIYGARIVALRFASAIGTNHLIGMRFYKFLELFSATFAFVL